MLLDLEKLNYQERISYQNLVEQYKIKQLSVEDIKDSITKLLFAAIRELAEVGLDDKRDLFLKARVKNYLVLLDILTVPEQVEKQLSEAVKKLEKRIK
jgi:hypothetical protein